MSNYGQQPPYGQNRPIRTGSSSPGRTGNRQPDANLSRRIRASRGRTSAATGQYPRRSSRTVSPVKDRTGNNRRSGLRNHPP